MDPTAIAAITKLINDAVEKLESPPAGLDVNDKEELGLIREEFKLLLVKTHSYCIDYAPVYKFLQDSYEVFTVEEIKDYLLTKKFDEIVKDAKAITKISFQTSTRINRFIGTLKAKYTTRGYKFDGQFWAGILSSAAGIGLLVGSIFCPALVIPGALICAGGSLKLIVWYIKQRDNLVLDKELASLEIQLKGMQEDVNKIGTSADTLSEKASLIDIALGIGKSNGKEKEYIRDMCSAFDQLKTALHEAIGANHVGKSSLLSDLATVTIASGVVAGAVAVTSSTTVRQVLPEVIEHSRWCIIM
jgi:hypothetical protein